MRAIAIFGGSGFIGGELARHYASMQVRTVIVTRSERQDKLPYPYVEKLSWSRLEQEPALLENFEAFVNLAGESINQRWTARAKQTILHSRLEAVSRVAEIVSRLDRKPRAVVQASGISIYGTSERALFDEQSHERPDADFLAGVVGQWEQAAEQIRDVRLVKLRIGIVLGDGGALPLMALPYKFFVGGRVGSGSQPISWIHVHDMVRLIQFCIDNDAISGPVNATAPQPVTNDELGRALAKAMKRPHWMPVPAKAFAALLGEMSELLLKGQRVLPNEALKHGFSFQFPTIDKAMNHLYSK